jgi:hypothetical protein
MLHFQWLTRLGLLNYSITSIVTIFIFLQNMLKNSIKQSRLEYKLGSIDFLLLTLAVKAGYKFTATFIELL